MISAVLKLMLAKQFSRVGFEPTYGIGMRTRHTCTRSAPLWTYGSKHAVALVPTNASFASQALP